MVTDSQEAEIVQRKTITLRNKRPMGLGTLDLGRFLSSWNEMENGNICRCRTAVTCATVLPGGL